MNTVKIYIQLLDGSIAWTPVNAINVAQNQYKIIEDKEFTEYVDPLYLHEYYPGDIVELGDYLLNDGKIGQVANKLIAIGQWPDRKFKEFKFKATVRQLKFDKETAEKYRDEINRIKKENLAGQFFYPALIDTVDKLSSFIISDQL